MTLKELNASENSTVGLFEQTEYGHIPCIAK